MQKCTKKSAQTGIRWQNRSTAWVILSCLGFYQMCPSRPDFTMSLPLFDKATVRLANGRTLLIEKAAFDAENMRNKIGYEELMQGGSLAEIARRK